MALIFSCNFLLDVTTLIAKRVPKIQIADISKSYNCRLARMLRKRLSRLNINKGVKVVFSSEEVLEDVVRIEEGQNKKSTVGTISYMPPIFGCFISSVVIRELIS